MLICFHLTLGFLQVSPGERMIRSWFASHTGPCKDTGGARPVAQAPEVAAGGWSCCSQMGSLFPHQAGLLAQEAPSRRGTFWGSQPCYFYTLTSRPCFLFPQEGTKLRTMKDHRATLKGHLLSSAPRPSSTCQPVTSPYR